VEWVCSKSLWMNERLDLSMWEMDVRLDELRRAWMLTIFFSMSMPFKGAGIV
jgi:hypothetical protein